MLETHHNHKVSDHSRAVWTDCYAFLADSRVGLCSNNCVTGIKEPDMLTGMTYLDGNPLDFHLTGREVSDSTQFETSLDIGPDVRPRIAMTEKGYDSQSNRTAALAHGITPVIPRRRNSKQRGRFFPKRLYKLRARIEQAIAKLKRFKRVAMRCEKTDISYSAIIRFACGLMPAKTVHTT